MTLKMTMTLNWNTSLNQEAPKNLLEAVASQGVFRAVTSFNIKNKQHYIQDSQLFSLVAIYANQPLSTYPEYNLIQLHILCFCVLHIFETQLFPGIIRIQYLKFSIYILHTNNMIDWPLIT